MPLLPCFYPKMYRIIGIIHRLILLYITLGAVYFKSLDLAILLWSDSLIALIALIHSLVYRLFAYELYFTVLPIIWLILCFDCLDCLDYLDCLDPLCNQYNQSVQSIACYNLALLDHCWIIACFGRVSYQCYNTLYYHCRVSRLIDPPLHNIYSAYYNRLFLEPFCANKGYILFKQGWPIWIV